MTRLREKTNIVFLLLIMIVLSMTLISCGSKSNDESERLEGLSNEKVEINVSAAASLTDALIEIQKEYERQNEVVILYNFAASGALQKQIMEGAPCDLFLSASKQHMDALETEGLIVTESRADLLSNALTLIVSAEQEGTVKDYTDLTKPELTGISIGTPESVPAGKYAKQALENMGIWDKLGDKIIYAKDVRQVLEYVDTGNADCGLVYKSDTLSLKTGIAVMDLAESSHDPIVYPAALVKDSAQQQAAAEFYEFLQTEYAAGVFEKYGFNIL